MLKDDILKTLKEIKEKLNRDIPPGRFFKKPNEDNSSTKINIDNYKDEILELKDDLKNNSYYLEILKLMCNSEINVEIAWEVYDLLGKIEEEFGIKRILVIGNGFDLAHDLPTKYSNFLEFCIKARSMYFYLKNESEEKIKILLEESDDSIKELLYQVYCGQTDVYYSYIEEIVRMLDGNVWYEHFVDELRRNNNSNKTWIDFESEICKQVIEIEKFQNRGASNNSLRIVNQKLLNKYTTIKNKSPRTNNDAEIIKELYIDLKRLTRALEIYIDGFVSGISVQQVVKEIKNEKYDFLISFNYSSTFEKYYQSNLFDSNNICYIHGKANVNNNTESCNLVLGINEYLSDEDKNQKLTFLSYKKFYQRIYKGTDTKYSKWIDDIKENKTDYEITFFGHSLDVTDKDILSKLIINDNVKTKIFYYRKFKDDKEDLCIKISNLIKVIGQDELIKRTSGGKENTIEFIAQSIKEE